VFQFLDGAGHLDGPLVVQVELIGVEIDFADAALVKQFDFLGDGFRCAHPYPGLARFPDGIGAEPAIERAAAAHHDIRLRLGALDMHPFVLGEIDDVPRR